MPNFALKVFMTHPIILESITHINHNVVRLITSKPDGYTFKPGQATNMAIDQPGQLSKKRPFTFTNLPNEDCLEFTIKIYPSHHGVTKQIETLTPGTELIIENPWGTIHYKGEGTFIAGGAGITPFIAILKDLRQKGQLQNNRLFFGSKTEKDIIYKMNLEAWLGTDFNVVLSDEKHDAYAQGHIDAALLTKHNIALNKPVYLCGPPNMMNAVKEDLYTLGLPDSQLVTEA